MLLPAFLAVLPAAAQTRSPVEPRLWVQPGTATSCAGLLGPGVHAGAASQSVDVDGDGDLDELLHAEKDCDESGTRCRSSAVILALRSQDGWSSTVLAAGEGDQQPVWGESGALVSGGQRFFWVRVDLLGDSEGDRARYFVLHNRSGRSVVLWEGLGHGSVTSFELSTPPGSLLLVSLERGSPWYKLLLWNGDTLEEQAWSRRHPGTSSRR